MPAVCTGKHSETISENHQPFTKPMSSPETHIEAANTSAWFFLPTAAVNLLRLSMYLLVSASGFSVSNQPASFSVTASKYSLRTRIDRCSPTKLQKKLDSPELTRQVTPTRNISSAVSDAFDLIASGLFPGVKSRVIRPNTRPNTGIIAPWTTENRKARTRTNFSNPVVYLKSAK